MSDAAREAERAHSYPKNCKECYRRIIGTCLLWRQVRDLSCNKHSNCPENMQPHTAESEEKNE